ncbi:morphogenic membrane protein MmpA [Streptomyces cinereospinus]|uniref:Morphogenic membrane protein MmpA n=1 Tax=Streptomyces cinereospinus TaxID=285561 RepID=A0ABV5MZ76_9ACTN
MTTHRARAPQHPARASRSGERVVTLALVLAVPAGLAWLAAMVYTLAVWSL